MFDQVRRGLTPAARHLGIKFWDDQTLHTGELWHPAIAAADVFVALVSFESLYSDYIWQHELPAMRARSQATGALILPVVLNQCHQ